MRRLIPFLIGFAFIMQAAAQPARLTVFAAASLSEAMKAIDQAWVAKDHPPLSLSFAASSTLARQLDHGAGANIFASADDAWMNWAIDRHLIDAASRRDVVSTQLVLIVPKEKEHPQQIDLKPGFDLVALLGQIGAPGGRRPGPCARGALREAGADQSWRLGHRK